MRTGLIGKKIGSSSYFQEKGTIVPITLVKIDECIVCGIKTEEKNGYNAIQIITQDKDLNNKKINKPQKKLFAKINIDKKNYLKAQKSTKREDFWCFLNDFREFLRFPKLVNFLVIFGTSQMLD